MCARPSSRARARRPRRARRAARPPRSAPRRRGLRRAACRRRRRAGARARHASVCARRGRGRACARRAPAGGVGRRWRRRRRRRAAAAARAPRRRRLVRKVDAHGDALVDDATSSWSTRVSAARSSARSASNVTLSPNEWMPTPSRSADAQLGAARRAASASRACVSSASRLARRRPRRRHGCPAPCAAHEFFSVRPVLPGATQPPLTLTLTSPSPSLRRPHELAAEAPAAPSSAPWPRASADRARGASRARRRRAGRCHPCTAAAADAGCAPRSALCRWCPAS